MSPSRRRRRHRRERPGPRQRHRNFPLPIFSWGVSSPTDLRRSEEGGGEEERGKLQYVVKTTLQLPRFRPNQQGCNAVGIYTDFALLAPNHTYTQSALINNYYVLLSYVSSSRHLYVHFGIKSYTQLALMNKLAPLTFRSSVENFVDYSTTTQLQSASTVLVGLSNEHRHLLVASSAMKPVESLRSSCSPQRPSVHVVVDDQRGKVVCYPSWTYFVFPFAFFFFRERRGVTTLPAAGAYYEGITQSLAPVATEGERGGKMSLSKHSAWLYSTYCIDGGENEKQH